MSTFLFFTLLFVSQEIFVFSNTIFLNPLSAEHFLKITKNLMKKKANLLTFW